MNEQIPFQPNDRATGAAQFFSRVQRYKSLLKRRWWVLLITLALAVGAQTYRASKTPLTYVSKGQMIVSVRNNITDSTAAAATDENFVGTTITLLKGSLITARAHEAIRREHPDLPRCEVLLDVQLVPKTSIFLLTARGAYPKYTHEYLNACMEEFLKYRDEMRGKNSAETMTAIREQMDNAQKQINEGRAELMAFQNQHNVASVEDEAKSSATRLSQLKDELHKLQRDQRMMEFTNEATTVANTANKDGTTSIELREQDRVRQQLAQLEQTRREYEDIYLPKHPKFVKLQEQMSSQSNLLAVLQTQSTEQLKTRRDAIAKNITTLQGYIEEGTKAAREASVRLASYDTIKSKIKDAESLSARIGDLLQKVKLDTVPTDPISVLEPAGIAKADNSGFTKNIAIGCFIGLIVGIGLLFLLDRFDDRPVSFTELQEHFDELVLGQIPQDQTRSRDRKLLPLTVNDTRYAYAEAHRNLRSSLIFMAIEGARPRTIVITSGVPGEGKSTVAVNLAITMAFSGSRVLLIDADMRKGTVHEYFEVADKPGLADVLSGDTPWSSVLHQTHVPNLSVMARGSYPPNPGELLLAGSDPLIKELYQHFDFILFDSAPVLAADDTACLAPKVDGTLFVIRAGYTSARLARNALDLLYQRQVNVMGIVFNSVETNSREYYYFKYPEYYSKRLVT
jgi:polysaccharide biosynthesis transport protein